MLISAFRFLLHSFAVGVAEPVGVAKPWPCR